MKKRTLLLTLVLIAVLLSACSLGKAKTLPMPEATPPQSVVTPHSSTAEEDSPTESGSIPATPPEEMAPDADKSVESLTPGTPPDTTTSNAASAPEVDPTPESEGDSAPDAPNTSVTPPVDGVADETESTWVYHEKVPILMYHEVNDLLANSLYLSVADFTAHLTYFEEAGITPISIQQLYDHWHNEAPLPEKPIILTFDDGYSSMYSTVYPLLKERGWSGTFYCITNLRWSEGHLSEEEIIEMAAGGMEIGSHTVSHLELNSLSRENRLHELTVSKNVLTSFAGKDVTMLCYPAGRYDENTKADAQETGYLCAVTTQYGFATKSQGMFDLKRIRVSSDCGAAWIKNVLAPLGY